MGKREGLRVSSDYTELGRALEKMKHRSRADGL